MANASERKSIMGAVTGRKVNATGWVRINCPVCPSRKGTEDRRISFGYRPLTGGFRCFRCGVNGRMQGAGYVLPEEADQTQDEDEIPVIQVPRGEFFQIWTDENINSPAMAEARDWLRARGFEREHWIAANIHVAVGGRYSGRVVVPHEHADGRWWGFTARTYPVNSEWAVVEQALNGGAEAPKVLYPKGMDRSMLYNEQALYTPSEKPVLLVEGCLDAVWYLPDAVACLGKPTSVHFEKLLSAKRPVVVCLDGDAWSEGQALAYRLRLRGVNAFWVKLPAKEDPNSIDPQWLRDKLAAAVDLAHDTKDARPQPPQSL